MVWALYSAYVAIVFHAVAQMRILQFGIADGPKFIDTESTSKLIKEALPHMAKFVDEYSDAGYHHVLESLEQELLKELRMMLEGADVDEASVVHSARILEAANKVQTDSTNSLAQGGSIERPGTG